MTSLSLDNNINWQQIVDSTLEKTIKDIFVLKPFYYPDQVRKLLTQQKKEKDLKNLYEKGTFLNGYLPPKYFQKVKERRSITGYRLLTFDTREGIKPSQALDYIFQKKNAIVDCALAVNIIFWEFIRRLLKNTHGKENEKFDFLFPSNSATQMRLQQPGSDQYYSHNIIHQLLRAKPVQKSIIYKKGECYTFFGPEKIHETHPQGHFGCYFTICVESGDNPRFMAHGFPTEGLNIDQIKELFAKEFLEPAKTIPDIPMEMLKNLMPDEAERDKAIEAHGKLDHIKDPINPSECPIYLKKDQILELDVERLKQLVDSEPSKGAQLLKTWLNEYREKYFPQYYDKSDDEKSKD